MDLFHITRNPREIMRELTVKSNCIGGKGRHYSMTSVRVFQNRRHFSQKVFCFDIASVKVQHGNNKLGKNFHPVGNNGPSGTHDRPSGQFLEQNTYPLPVECVISQRAFQQMLWRSRRPLYTTHGYLGWINRPKPARL